MSTNVDGHLQCFRCREIHIGRSLSCRSCGAVLPCPTGNSRGIDLRDDVVSDSCGKGWLPIQHIESALESFLNGQICDEELFDEFDSATGAVDALIRELPGSESWGDFTPAIELLLDAQHALHEAIDEIFEALENCDDSLLSIGRTALYATGNIFWSALGRGHEIQLTN